MIQRIWRLFLVFGICLLLAGCGKEETDYVDPTTISFHRHIASSMNDQTGWYYQFLEEDVKNADEAPFFAFRGINLRHRYDDAYWTRTYMQDKQKDGSDVYYCYRAQSGVLLHGDGGEDQQADRVLIGQFFQGSPSVIQLIRKTESEREDYSFRTLDTELFFTLVSEGLRGVAREPGTSKLYWEKPTYAMEVEPDYVDGYKFQVGFVMEMGHVGEVYIDVLYQTGEAYNEYVQLSDLVEERKANEEMFDAFMLIGKIRTAIKEEDSFLAFAERYKERTIGRIDFARLYDFLRAIHFNEDARYNNEKENPPRLREEISRDAFEAANPASLPQNPDS